MPPQPSTSAAPPPLPAALVFDACNVGVVLRAVLFVQAVAATAAMFGADSPLQWLENMALLTGASLPGTLVWLVAACLLKHPLQRLPSTGQYAAGVLLGMAAGLYACAMLQLAGGNSAPWLASPIARPPAPSSAAKAAMLIPTMGAQLISPRIRTAYREALPAKRIAAELGGVVTEVKVTPPFVERKRP